MARSTLKQPYWVFARFYDQLGAIHQRLFRRARQRMLGPLLPRVRAACDLCCGTGTWALELARDGQIKVYGVDASAPMCRVARRKARQAGTGVQVLQADMRRFRLPEPVELITCEFDALNHLPRKQDLKAVAHAVARALAPGGYFCFDVNTRRAFKEVWPLSRYGETRDFVLASHGGYDARRDKAWAALEWFLPAGRLWRRFTERYEEVCWSDKEIRAALRAVGLRVLRTWDQTRFQRGAVWLRPGCRIFYLARKLPAR